MPQLYKQYCYQSNSEVIDSILSEMIIPEYGQVTSATNNLGDITVNYIDSNTGINSTFVFNPPNCQTLGFDNSFTGITPVEAVELSWLVVTALIAAYAVVILRKAL